MKKILMGTTAVVALATMSTEAFAADKIKLELGGFMRHYVSVSDNDEVAPGHGGVVRGMDLGQRSNTEVYFTGSTTLDNGLTVAARIEMEADGENSANNTDGSWMTISSDAMGALSMGAMAHASDGFRVGAPTADGWEYADFQMFAMYSTGATTDSADNAPVAASFETLDDDKSAKIAYVSPALGDMVTVFASYSAAEGAGTAIGDNLTTSTGQDGHSIGVSLSGEFSGASVEAAAMNVGNGNANQEMNNFGLSVGMAGFTVGGSYSDMNDKAAGSNALDGNAWDLGVSYQTGPYAVAVRYMNAEDNGTVAGSKDEDTVWAVDATYDLGAGVNLAATYFNQSSDPAGTTAALASRDTSGIIAGIEVGF